MWALRGMKACEAAYMTLTSGSAAFRAASTVPPTSTLGPPALSIITLSGICMGSRNSDCTHQHSMEISYDNRRIEGRLRSLSAAGLRTKTSMLSYTPSCLS